MLRNRKGFTLIELLIVVVIIGILAAIAIPKFANTKAKAYVSAMKSDLKNLSSAEEGFYSDSAKYTTNVTGAAPAGLGFKGSTGVGAPVVSTVTGGWFATVYHTQTTTTCAIAVNATNPISATAGEGEPVCKYAPPLLSETRAGCACAAGPCRVGVPRRRGTYRGAATIVFRT